MRIVVVSGEFLENVTLEDPDDFKHFSVVIVGADMGAVGNALEPYGTLIDARSAVISAHALKQLSGRANDKAWMSAFERMLFHADQAGWVDAKGIRAHCEWTTAAAWAASNTAREPADDRGDNA
jgi:hypothetical protein